MVVRGHGGHGSPLKGMLQGGRLRWLAPSYPQLTKSNIWPDLKRVFENVPSRVSEVERSITLRNGGFVQVCVVGEDASQRGDGLDGCVIDEAAFIDEEVWKTGIRPSLLDKQGWAAFLTTPNGKNWIYKRAELVRTGQRPEWRFWQRPSSDNPLVTQDELDLVLQEIGPIAYRQEHEAQFTEIEGALFPGSYFEDHIWANYWPNNMEMGSMFVDPSMGNESKPGDYSAIWYTGLAQGLVWGEADMARRTPLQIVIDTIAMYQRLRPAVVGIESNAFQAVLATLFDMHCEANHIPPLPLVMVHHSERKDVRIQRLDPYLARKMLRFKRCPGCEIAVDQTQQFTPRDKNKNNHDDGPDGLEGSIRLLNQIALRSEGDE